MTIEREFTHKGHNVKIVSQSQNIALVGGRGTNKQYMVLVDDQPRPDLLFMGSLEEKEHDIKHLLDAEN